MVFTDFINLRDELSDIAFNCNGFTTIAANSPGDITPNLSQASCQLDGLTYNYSNAGLIIKDSQDIVIKSIPYDEISDHLADVVPGTSSTVSDVMSTFSQSGDLYSTLAMITQKYSYSSRISLTDLNAMIDVVNDQSSLNYDVSSLKQQLLSCSNNDGYVTNKAWLVSVKYWIKECEDGASNESPELDNTSPNILSGLYSIISPILQTTLSAIFTAIGAIFGTVGLLIGMAFSKLFDVIKTGVSESGSINADACNLFSKGVCISKEIPKSGITTEMDPYVANDYSINYNQLDSCGVFFWKADDPNNIRVNAYLAPKHSPENTFEELDAGTSAVTWNGLGLYKSRASWPFVFNPGMTSAQEELCATDIGYYSACLCTSELVRWLRSTPQYTYDGSSKVAQSIQLNIIPGQSFNLPDNRFARAICVGLLVVLGFKNYDNIYQLVSRTDVIDSANYLVSAAWDLRDSFEDLNWFDWNPSGSWSGTHMSILCNPLYTSDAANAETSARLSGLSIAYAYDDINHQVEVTGYEYHVFYNDIVYKANSLPTSFCAEFSALSSEVVRSILITSALVAIAGAVVSLKVSKAMRLKKIKKQTLRSDKIADAKARYENFRDPDREGGMKTPEEINGALNDYVKEVDKFNRMGKIFHWGSYDAANSWINAPESGNSTATTMTGIIDLFQNQRNSSNSSFNTLKSDIVGTNNYTLDDVMNILIQIKNLIV